MSRLSIPFLLVAAIAVCAPSAVAQTCTGTSIPAAYVPGVNGPVFALTVLPNGDVIAGGSFTAAGGAGANNMARFSPSVNTWSSIGTGTGDVVNALQALPSGGVLAGGLFTTAGGSAAASFVRWTPHAACPADFDCSGSLGINDIFDFLAAWFAGSPAADFNGTNGIGIPDIFDFLAAWFAGC